MYEQAGEFFVGSGGWIRLDARCPQVVILRFSFLETKNQKTVGPFTQLAPFAAVPNNATFSLSTSKSAGADKLSDKMKRFSLSEVPALCNVTVYAATEGGVPPVGGGLPVGALVAPDNQQVSVFVEEKGPEILELWKTYME